MIFLIGFLPSIAAIVIAMTRFGWHPGLVRYLLLGTGMGIMGFGGAKYKADQRLRWLVAGFLMWFLFIITPIGRVVD